MKKNNKIIFIIYILTISLVCGDVFAKSCVYCNNTYIPFELSVLSRNVIRLIQILVPVIIIITGMIELLRSVIASDEKKMEEAKSKLIRKIIAGVIIFLIFAIVKFGFGFLGKKSKGILQCANYFINEEGTKTTCPDREGYEGGGSEVKKKVYSYCSDQCEYLGAGTQAYGQCITNCQGTTTGADVDKAAESAEKEIEKTFSSCYDTCTSKYGSGNQAYGQCMTECQK